MAVTRSQSRMGRALTRMRDDIGRRRRQQEWIKRYKASDTSKRHRLKDNQPKTQRVVSYTRRT